MQSRPRRYIDLHTHSSASDGADPPAVLVQKADALRLAALAITDHGTVAGLDEAEEAARDLQIEFIRGCEMSSRGAYAPLHILGLWLPRENEALESLLRFQAEQRRERNLRMLERIQALGIGIADEDVKQACGGADWGRLHLARLLLERGLVPSIGEAFSQYLGRGAAAHVPMEAPGPERIVAELKAVGATVALAHPMQIRCPREWLLDFLHDMKRHGLDAVEAYHADHNPAQTRWLVHAADRLGLALTGGSDCHGSARPGLLLGTGWGGLRVPLFALERLKDLRRKQGLPV